MDHVFLARDNVLGLGPLAGEPAQLSHSKSKISQRALVRKTSAALVKQEVGGQFLRGAAELALKRSGGERARAI